MAGQKEKESKIYRKTLKACEEGRKVAIERYHILLILKGSKER